MKRYFLKNFMPLIIIFLIIGLSTLTKQLLSSTRNIHTVMQDFMGIFFLVFGTFKIINIKKFAESYAIYDLIAKHSRLYALIYPFIELSLGIFYMLRWHLLFAHWMTLLIMLISSVGVVLELSKGSQIMCACLGMVFKVPMTYVTLFEDLLMALMAALMIILSF